MGEFEFIERIRRTFADVGNEAMSSEGDYMGIGDDCAVLPTGNGQAFVVTTDMLIEGIHFLRGGGEARQLGAKSLAVSLSDIAAMGARPVASFLSIALPPDTHDGWADEFMAGYRELSERHNVRLAGGDTTSSRGPVAINVTVIGRASACRLKYRSGAKTGDIVVVGGPLGESAAGLHDILNGHHDTAAAHTHRNPTPQVAEGEWLGGREEVHSMIDLSDGLASDLLHILRASVVAAEIELTSIPTSVSTELAVTGGEDYKLLFTVASDDFARLCEDYSATFASTLYPVGSITDGAPAIVWLENGVPVTKDWHGFTHF